MQLLAEASDDAPLGRFLPDIPAPAEDEVPTYIPLRRSAVASTLIAGLELARDGVVTLHQHSPFATITLCACTEMTRDQIGETVA